jgi:hypothetical protein
MYAILVAVPATPLKPSAAAIKAITKNVSAQLNMMHLPFPLLGLGWARRLLTTIRWRHNGELFFVMNYDKVSRNRRAEDLYVKRVEPRPGFRLLAFIWRHAVARGMTPHGQDGRWTLTYY